MTHTPTFSRKPQVSAQGVNKKMCCPYCCAERTKRDGTTIKGFQRYFCYICRRYWQDAYIRRAVRKFDEQKELLAWAKLNPLLARHLIALPAGVSPNQDPIKSRTYTKTESVSDMLLAYPRAPYHGLWIELKKYNLQTTTQSSSLYEREQNQSISASTESESEWLRAMQSVGYDVKVVYGWQEAAQKITEYLAWN